MGGTGVLLFSSMHVQWYGPWYSTVHGSTVYGSHLHHYCTRTKLKQELHSSQRFLPALLHEELQQWNRSTVYDCSLGLISCWKTSDH